MDDVTMQDGGDMQQPQGAPQEEPAEGGEQTSGDGASEGSAA